MKRNINILFSALIILLCFSLDINAQTADELKQKTSAELKELLKKVIEVEDYVVADKINAEIKKREKKLDSSKKSNAKEKKKLVAQDSKNTKKDAVSAPKEVKPKKLVFEKVIAKDTVLPEKKAAINTSPPVLKKREKPKKIVPSSTLAYSYTVPIEELRVFYNAEGDKLSKEIRIWENKISESIKNDLDKRKVITSITKLIENKKNASSKMYNTELKELNAKLIKHREQYVVFQKESKAEGEKMAERIKEYFSKSNQNIDEKTKNVSAAIKNYEPNPSIVLATKNLDTTSVVPRTDIDKHIYSVSELLFFYQNERKEYYETVLEWNKKAISIKEQDDILKYDQEPLISQLAVFNKDPKKNKTQISALENQYDIIEKKRKELEKQMLKDSKTLSLHLKEKGKTTQAALEERINDIIATIEYSYLIGL